MPDASRMSHEDYLTPTMYIGKSSTYTLTDGFPNAYFDGIGARHSDPTHRREGKGVAVQQKVLGRG